MGGAAAVICSQRSHTSDYNIAASVALNPAYCVGCELTINVPIFYGAGTNDSLISSSYVQGVFDRTPKPPKIYGNMINATHFEPNLPDGRWDAYAAAWFGCYLRDDETACNNIYDSSNPNSLCNAYPFAECILDP